MDSDSRYERDLERAQAEGTDFIERTDDLPEPDRYHAARGLADLLREGGEDLPRLAGEIGLAGEDPALWESLDVARAAAYAREKHAEPFGKLVEAHPWLAASADSAAPGALGSLADRFLGHG